MLKIGVTGGIGSGKTTVCKIFQVLGIAIYNSDQRAKEIMALNQDLKSKLAISFGPHIFDSDKKLKSAILASIVFSDPQKLATLNSIVHPYVLDDFSAFCNEHRKEPYIILESAIIFESGIDKMLDQVVIVDAPIEIKIERIMARDDVNRIEVQQRMHNQLNPDEKNSLSKLIVFNDGRKSLIDQVMSLHKGFSEL